MINYCSRKGVFCTMATDLGYCCATACMKTPDYVEVLSFGDVKIIGSDGREYVPIVRCKECKHWNPNGIGICKLHDIRPTPLMMDDWFCADGERTHG